MANFIASHWLALTLFFTPGILAILIVRGGGSPDPETLNHSAYSTKEETRAQAAARHGPEAQSLYR